MVLHIFLVDFDTTLNPTLFFAYIRPARWYNLFFCQVIFQRVSIWFDSFDVVSQFSLLLLIVHGALKKVEKSNVSLSEQWTEN